MRPPQGLRDRGVALGCAVWMAAGIPTLEAAKKTAPEPQVPASRPAPMAPVAGASVGGSGPAARPGQGGTSAPVVLKAERQRPVEIPDPWRWVILGGVVLGCAGAGIAAAAWWRRRGAGAVPALPPPDPATVARARILGARRGMEDARWYVGEVSDAVRGYLEGRFGLRAPEQTTEEFLAGLAGKELPGMGDAAGLGEFLGWCDLVKFSGWKPGGAELEELEQAGLGMVERTMAGAGVMGGAATMVEGGAPGGGA